MMTVNKGNIVDELHLCVHLRNECDCFGVRRSTHIHIQLYIHLKLFVHIFYISSKLYVKCENSFLSKLRQKHLLFVDANKVMA